MPSRLREVSPRDCFFELLGHTTTSNKNIVVAGINFSVIFMLGNVVINITEYFLFLAQI